MEKLYCIVDAQAPADDSIVKFEDNAGVVSLEIAEAFISANQVDLAEPIDLGNDVIITKRYTLIEAQQGTEE